MIRMGKHVYRVLEPGIVYPFDAISILVDQGDHLSLIDSGTGLTGVYEQIMHCIIYLGLTDKRVSRVYNTHCHISNAGGDYILHKYQSAMITAHEWDSKAIREGDPLLTDSFRFNTKFHPTPVGYVLRNETGLLEDDLVKLEYIHTPGHTPGSTTYVIHDPMRTIVSIGDALGSLNEKWASSKEKWMKTLDKLKELEADAYCTSVKCYTRREFIEYLDRIEKEGPIWISE
ncbi:MAG: MBL fold metallo-hydrolase [Desulfurococcales archaeon]|nr:MBL fold metallo-hydrolase [Desulfurococcales archaeon]